MNIIFRIILFFIIFLTFYQGAGGQSDTDSLELRVELGKVSHNEKFRNIDKSLEFAQQELDLSVSTGNQQEELKSLNTLGEIFIDKTELKTAMDYAVRANALAKQLEDPSQQLRALYSMGLIYTQLGNYDKSSEMFYECLRLSEQINDEIMKVKALNSIGIVYHNQSNYDKALKFYYKALTNAREIRYSKGISKGLNNLAAIYGIKEDNIKVAQYLSEAIILNKELNDVEMLGVNYLNYGYYFQVQKKYDSALNYYNEALTIYEGLDNVASVISTKIFLAEYYLEVGNTEKSKTFAKEVLEAGKHYGLKRFVYESAALLSKIYLLQNDSLQAYKYQVLELQIKDSLNIEESQTELSKLELQYELDKAEQKNRIAEQRKDMIIIIVVTSLIFVIIIIILMLSRMRIKANSVKLENDKLEMSLELRSKELTANVMSIMKKNNTLWQIAKKLKVIQKEAVKDETKIAIRKITTELNKAVEDEQWEEFELRFNQTHNEFYNKLLASFPNLTPQDLRLCAFLRLNMTTKEISELTGQRTSTIEMARTRLRKKLNITNTQTNLITFLTKI